MPISAKRKKKPDFNSEPLVFPMLAKSAGYHKMNETTFFHEIS